MPKRNLLKQYGEGEFYHLYNRGVAKMDIFRDKNDYEYMLYLLASHLGTTEVIDKKGRQLNNYSEKIDLVAYCLMPNHYHLFVYLKSQDGIEKLMRSVMTRYSMYFNRKYKRVGGLFESRFLASRITGESYFWHISRYIHLNPIELGVDYAQYAFSSVKNYIAGKNDEWLHPEWVMDIGDSETYRQFLTDYESMHDLQKQIKAELAHL